MNPNDIEGLEDYINGIIEQRISDYHRLNIVPLLKNSIMPSRNDKIEDYADRVYSILKEGQVRYFTLDALKKEFRIYDRPKLMQIVDCFFVKYSDEGAIKETNTSRRLIIRLGVRS